MKENKYDDEKFFNKYGQMARSQLGLEGAGEWSTLKALLPDFNGKSVLDLGCGYGWHCGYAVQNGATSVTGVDISSKMLEEAIKRNFSEKIKYVCSAVEDYEFPVDAYDIVLSSMAFHYVKDYEALVKKIYASLKQSGYLIFSVEHPAFTAQGPQQWHYDAEGKIMHFPIDNYYYEGEREAIFLDEKVIKYHRTLTSYVDTLLNSGFVIERLVEPKPPETMMDIEGMKDEMRRPLMLILVVRKLK